jgi:phasin family protein
VTDKTFLDMFSDFGRQMKLPQVDFEAVMSAHRKNIEALTKSAAALTEGGRSILAKEQEIAAQVMDQTRELVSQFTPTGNPQEIMAKQGEFARRVFESSIANMRDISALAQKSTTEASGIIMQRVRESVAEARSTMEVKK